MSDTKECYSCNEVLPTAAYEQTAAGNLKRSCKACLKKAQQDYVAKNAERIKEVKDKSYAKSKNKLVPVDNTDRTCHKCGLFKLATEFTYRKRQTNNVCKECVSSYQREYRAANADKMKEYKAAHVALHRDKIRVYKRLWARKNSLQQAQSTKAWRLNNPGKANALTWRRRAHKLRATPAWADQKKIKGFYETSAGLSMLLGEWYNVDHIVPLQSQYVCGLHCEANLQVILKSENQSKNNRWWPDMWEPVPLEEITNGL
jgi:hypothetical protein